MNRLTKPTNEFNSKNKVWNSEKVTECIRLIEDGKDIPGGTPFHEGDPSWRAADIVFEYDDLEIQEIAKCAADVVYFGNNHCKAMTDYGIQKITLRPYQVDVLKSFQANRFNVFLASRQIGKSFFRQTLVEIKSKKTESVQLITFYELYFSTLKKTKRLSIYEKLNYFLCKIESKLTHGKIYKLEI